MEKIFTSQSTYNSKNMVEQAVDKKKKIHLQYRSWTLTHKKHSYTVIQTRMEKKRATEEKREMTDKRMRNESLHKSFFKG